MSDSVRPHRWQPARPRHPWDSPGKNTGVGCHLLLQCLKVKSESEVAQSCLTLRDPMDCGLPGSSAHGIFQARVLERGAIAFSVSKASELFISWSWHQIFNLATRRGLSNTHITCAGGIPLALSGIGGGCLRTPTFFSGGPGWDMLNCVLTAPEKLEKRSQLVCTFLKKSRNKLLL